MNFSLVACKQFLKDYIDDNPDVAFGSEDRDVIASEISRTSMQFTFEKLSLLIKKLKNEGRLNKPQENKMNQQKTQTPADRISVLRDYFINDFPRCFPHLEQILDASGKVLCKPSYVLMFDAIRGLEFVRKDLINEILLDLDSKELLVRKGPERVVEVEKQPDPKVETRRKFLAAHDAGLLNSSKHNRNELDDEWNRGKATPLPMTERQRVELNAKNERDNQIIADVQSRINNFTGATHSKTYSGRDALKQTFVDAMNKRLSAEAVQKAVEAKIDSMAGNNSVR